MSNPRIIFGVSSSQIYKDENTSDLVLMNNTTAVMNIGLNENVGIGKVSSSTHKLDVEGSMGISGSIIPSLTSAFDLGSTTNRFNDLYLDGDSIFIGDSVINDVSGVLSVSGTMQLNALNVTNNVDIDGTLDVAGNSQLESLNVTSDVDFNGDLDVAGTAQLNAVNVTGNADIDGTLNAQGVATFQDQVVVQGAIDANSSANFQGAVVMQSTLETQGTATANALVVTNNADLNGALDVSGNAQVGSLNVTANADIDGTLNAQGVATFQDQIVVQGAIDANSTSNFQGDSVFQAALRVDGAIDANSTSNFQGAAVFQATVEAQGTATANALVVTNDADLNGALDVAGTAQLNALNVTNDADINGALDVQGATNLQANLAVDTDTLFVNASTDRVGINNAAPSTSLHITGTDGLVIPVGTNAQRVDVTGAIRYNTENSTFEGYKGTWGSLGGVVDVDQDTKIEAEDAAGNDNDQLRFYTAGSERMIVNADGSVGIGVTSSGTYKLELEGNMGIQGHIIPKANETYDLGSNEARFRDLYLSGSSIIIGQSEIVDNGGVLATQQLKITGASEFVGAMQVDGASQFNSNMDVNADMNVSGNATVGSLNATANADIDGTLDVQGATNLQAALTVGGAVDVNNSSNFSGAMVLQSTLEVQGNSQLASMNVTGNADIDGTLDVASTAQLNALNVTGNADVDGTLDVQGATNLQDDLVVDTDKFVVDISAGRVGMGVAAPEKDLHVKSTSGSTVLLVESTSAAAVLTLKSKNDSKSQVKFGDPEDSDIGRIEYDHSNNKMTFETNDTEQVVIDSSGNMGIGVDAPAAQLDVASTSKFGGNMDLNADLDVQGAANLQSTLTVGSNADLNGNLDVALNAQLGSLNVTANADIDGTMDVQGAANLQSSLTVAGAIDANSSMNLQGAAVLQNTMEVQGNSQLASLNVTGNADVDGTFDAQGAANFQSTLTVANDADLNGALDVSGNAQLGSLNVTGNADIDGTFDAQGAANLQSTLTVAGSIDANSSMNLQGAAVLQSSLETQGTATLNALNVTNDSDLTGNLAVGGNADLNGTLDVSGASQLASVNVTGNADVDGTLDVQGATNLQAALTVGGALDANSTSNFQGAAVFQAAVQIDGAIDANSSMNLQGAAVLQSSLETQGTATLNALVVTNDADLNGALDVQGASTLQSTLNVAANAHVASLNVTGSGDIDGDLVIDGNLTVHGTTTTVNTDQVTIEDPFIQLAANNGSDVVDIGFYGKYNDGSTDQYTGLFRDANSSDYRLFNTQTAPTNTVNTSAATYVHSNLTLNDLNADGNLVAQGTAQIVGQATVNSLVVTNDADLNGALDVSGNAQLGSLNVTANTDIDGSLDVQQAANFQSTLTVADSVDINASMDVSGTAQLNAVNVTNNADIDGTLDVQGAANLQAGLTVGGAVDINNSADISGTAQIGALNVTNDADLNGALDVQGAANFQNNVTLAGALDANSTSNFQGAAVFQAAVQIDGAIDANNSMNLQGAAVLQSTMEVQGNSQLASVNVTGNADIDGTFDAQGAANFQSTVAIQGNVDLNADADISGTAQINALNVTNDTDLNGALDVAGTAQLNALNVTGNADVDGTLDVQGVASFQDDLVVDTDKFIVDQSTGFVSIGRVATTGTKFDVYNADGLVCQKLESGNHNAVLKMISGTDKVGYLEFGTAANPNDGQIAYSNVNNSMTFRTNDVNRAYIDSSGNMGIGVPSPAAQLDVASTSKFGGNMDLNADLDVQGAANLQSTFTLAGDADLNAALDVQGAANFQSTVAIQGNADLNGTLDVASTAQLAALNVSGNADIDGTLDVQGAANFQSTSAFAANMDVNADLDVSGNAQLGSLNVTANADIDGTMDVQGATNLQSTLTVAADVDINAAMNVSGNATVGSLNATANADIDGTLDVQGAANLQSTLTVAGSIDANSSMNLQGAAVLQSTLEVQGNSQLASVNVTGNADIDGTLDAQGAANLQSTLTVAGDADLNGALDVDGNAQLGSLNVTNDADIDGTLNIQGVATFQNDLVVDTNTLFVDVSTDRVGINNATPETSLHISATDGLVIPVGTNAQRVDVTGAIRYNTDNSTFEGYKGTWGSLGGVIDVDGDTKITAENSAGADNDQLRLYTAGVERMAVNADGSLDIMGASDQVGAANFQSTLTLAGDADLNAALDVQGVASFQNDLVVDTDKFVVDQSTGLVGIGLAAPTKDLDIYRATGDANIQVQSGNQAAVLRLKAHSSSGSYLNFSDESDGNVGQVAYTHTDNKMTFRTNDVNRVYIDNAGNMGVGVAAPAAQLDVASTSKFGGNMDVNANMDVSGNAQLGSLNVTANADIDGTLDVQGAANLQAGLTVAGAADFNNSADFQGAVVMQSTLQVDGNMQTLSQGFNVKDYSGVARMSLGTTDAESSIHVRQANANMVLQNLNTTGTTELKFKNSANSSMFQVGYDDSNSVAYISEQNGNPLVLKINDSEKARLDNNGNLGIGKTALAGNKVGLAGNMNVDTGNAYKVANVVVLNASKLGDNVFNSSLKVVGELTSLAVSGATELKNTLDVHGALEVTGASTLKSTLDVQNTATLNALNVSNNADIDGTLDVQLGANFQSTAAFGGDVDINADADISGTAQVNALNVTNDADINGAMDVQGSANFQDDLVVDTDTLFVDASTDRVGINTAAPAYDLDVVGSGRFTQNLTVDGNLIVQGTSTTMNTEVVTIEDPLISLGANNSADAVDLGFYSKYNDGADKWSGLFRDASNNGEYSLFDGVTAEPSTTVDTANAGYALATLNLDELQGTTINASTEFIGAALKVTGNADLDGTLNVELASTLQSTLEVQSSATVNSLVVTNNADLNGALDVAGTAQLNALNVTGNTDIDGTLNVAALSTLDSLLVTNNGTVSGDLLVSLNTTLAGGLRVDSNTLVVDASGDKVGINITNPDNELDVNGVIQARNDMVVQGNLIIKGTNASSGDLNAIWAENIYGEGYLLKTAIGIGVTNPQYEVDVSGDINLTGDLYQNGSVVSLAGNVIKSSGTNAYYMAGNFGLGVTAPTNGKFEVVGDYGSVGLSSNAYNDLQADAIGLGDAGTFSYSVYASGKVAGSSFHAVSDNRVKNIVSERNNEEDKMAIENLNVYNYKYIDQPAYGRQTKIGIMAQDVEAIHSDLVEEQQKYIPNIYKECRLVSVNQVEVGNCDVVVGDMVKIQYKIDNEFMMCEKEVLAYEDGKMTLSAQDEDNSFDKESAFVYGKRVDDFKSVNFEQLTSLNTSAIKAIIQENKDLKAELAAIKEFIGM